MDISLTEAIRISGVCQKTIYNWTVENKFKFHRAVNRRLWIDKESFMQYLKELEMEYNRMNVDPRRLSNEESAKNNE